MLQVICGRIHLSIVRTKLDLEELAKAILAYAESRSTPVKDVGRSRFFADNPHISRERLTKILWPKSKNLAESWEEEIRKARIASKPIPKICLPVELEDLPIVASVSGGKDSTALILALKAANIPFRAVFADTGWEAKETYQYIEFLSKNVVPIDVVRAKPKNPQETRGAMIDLTLNKLQFPTRTQRWCTREMKIDPIKDYHRLHFKNAETVSVVGIRGQESDFRSKLPEVEDDSDWGGWIWRPLLNWTIEDVLNIHHSFDIPINPMYRLGYERVGCYPCIFSRKEEIRLIADTDPERIDLIRSLEQTCTNIRTEKNKEQPGRYSYEQATFFHTRDPDLAVMDIDRIVEWSRTPHGNSKHLNVLPDVPSGGCFRWGLCDKPTKKE